MCPLVHVCVCVLCVRGGLELKRVEKKKQNKKAKCSESDSQRLLLLDLIPSRVSCKDVEL